MYLNVLVLNQMDSFIITLVPQAGCQAVEAYGVPMVSGFCVKLLLHVLKYEHLTVQLLLTFCYYIINVTYQSLPF